MRDKEVFVIGGFLWNKYESVFVCCVQYYFQKKSFWTEYHENTMFPASPKLFPAVKVERAHTW